MVLVYANGAYTLTTITRRRGIMSNKIKSPNSGSSKGWIAGIIAIIAIIAVAVIFIITTGKSEKNNAAWDFSDTVLPDNVSVSFSGDSANGPYVEFTNGGEVKGTMDLYSDPRCPVCAKFEMENKDRIVEAINQGHALRFHPMTFLDEMTQSDYSQRTSTVLMILAENGDSEAAWKMYSGLWDNQPSESSNELPGNEDLAIFAESAGASDESVQQIKDMGDGEKGKMLGDDNASFMEQDLGRVSTPNLYINGTINDNPIAGGDKWMEELNS